jgi:hypothetical protein
VVIVVPEATRMRSVLSVQSVQSVLVLLFFAVGFCCWFAVGFPGRHTDAWDVTMRSVVVLATPILLAALACDRAEPPPATPECRGESVPSESVPIDSATRAELIVAREAVWRAYFAGDSAALTRLLPERMVGMGEHRADIIVNAQAFARGGGRLEKIEFTCDEFFVSGNVAVVFSSYRADLRQRRARGHDGAGDRAVRAT